MEEQSQTLTSLSLSATLAFRPLLLDPKSPTDRAILNEIKTAVQGLFYFDEIVLQLRDLIKLQHPKRTLTTAEYDGYIESHLSGCPQDEYGTWVYYPWRRSLVHLLPREEFIQVRTIRNAYKITFEEQAQLSQKRVGIIGLSVGQSASLAVAIERAAGEIRLADFDHLELSNLNRIRSSVCNLGLPKTHMVAREIAELDPYMRVRVWDEGITENNIEAFLTDGGALDLLIEECDSVDIKVLSREYARKHRIPVLMDTSDRGMIDVERYDLDPTYPTLHGLLDPSVDYAFLKTLKTSEEKLPYIAPILGIDTMSIRLRASALEVGQSISTWPQLGGDVMHGGALCVQYAKDILLGRSQESFRKFADSVEEERPHVTSQPRFSSDEQLASISREKNVYVWSKNVQWTTPSAEIINQICKDSSRASTPGNTQAFQWHMHDEVLYLVTDRKFSRAFSDNFAFGSQIGYGCLLANLEIAAAHAGYGVTTQLANAIHVDQPSVVAAIRFYESTSFPEVPLELYPFIPYRETTRTTSLEDELSLTDKDQIKEMMASYGASTQVLVDPLQIAEIKSITMACDIIRMTSKHGFNDLFKEEIIWDKKEYERKGEGIYIGDLNLNVKEAVGVQIYNNKAVNAFLGQIKGGQGFGDLTAKYLHESSTLVLFQHAARDLQSYISTGKQIQQLWLALTSRGYSMHPFTSSLMIGSYLISDENGYLTDQRTQLLALQERLQNIVGNDRPISFIAKIVKHPGTVGTSLRRGITNMKKIF
jgi:molybdopterin/thiamine biosynthesis adenylyltransferase